MSEILASESGHFYDIHGNPRYEVEYADKKRAGQFRPATVSDCRKNNWVPSVSVINRMLANPGIEQWRIKQVLLSSLTLPRNIGEDDESFAARVMVDSREQQKKAMELGTKIHADIERFYLGQQVDEVALGYALEVDRAIQAEFGSLKFAPEKSFAHPLGYGGKVDLPSLEGEGVVVDTKTKEFGPDDEVGGHTEHCRQLAAYRVGLGIPLAKCANVFVSTSTPGLVKIVHWKEEQLQQEFEVFKRLLEIWQITKKHKPVF